MNTEDIEWKCKACGGVLVRMGPLNAQGTALTAIDPETPWLYDKEHDCMYRTCPECGAKNAYRQVSSRPAEFVLDRIIS